MASSLHITNGDSLTEYLKQLEFSGEILTWREMLCEGPTCEAVFSEAFVAMRKDFLAADDDYDTFINQFEIDYQAFDEIILWFEYDLFCHVNLAACVSYLDRVSASNNLTLVCSGIVGGSEKLYGLAELTETQLHQHYRDRISLNAHSIKTLKNFWKAYCSDDHNRLKDVSITNQLPYLKSCIAHHFLRFPTSRNGLSIQELQVLELVKSNDFNTKREWIGASLRNQGYFGFGDLQYEAMLNRLSVFISEGDSIQLNELGLGVLENRDHVLSLLKDDTRFGGTLKYDNLYNPETKQLEFLS